VTANRKKPGVAFWTTVVVVVVLIAVAVYLTAYWWFVEPVPGGGIVHLNSSLQPVVAWYPRLGDSMDWEAVFTPANWLDRRLRPKLWQDVVVDLSPPVLRPHARSPSCAITNRHIVTMAENGVADAVITTVIHTRGGNFDTSPEAVTALVDAGISDAVIEAMRKATSSEPGDDE
jgi:hypothetical protein